MGVIRVKLANNYDALPIEAANNYVDGNKTVKVIAPNDILAGSWKIAGSVNLQKGFGAYAKTTSGYWGFAVCFLFNQATGYTALYDKHLQNQESAGTISPNYFKWWEAGNIPDMATWGTDASRGFASDSGTFVHPAWLAMSRLNEISSQDIMNIDFTYPSPIHQDQPNYYLNDTNNNIPLTKRTMQTSQRTDLNIPGTDQEQNEGFGAYGDNPWPKCSMQSFFSVNAQSSENPATIEESLSEAVNECFDNQQASWANQWETIDSEGGGPA